MERLLQKNLAKEPPPLLHRGRQHSEGLRADIGKHLLEFLGQLFPLTLRSGQYQERGGREEGGEGREQGDLKGLRGHVPPRVQSREV